MHYNFGFMTLQSTYLVYRKLFILPFPCFIYLVDIQYRDFILTSNMSCVIITELRSQYIYIKKHKLRWKFLCCEMVWRQNLGWNMLPCNLIDFNSTWRFTLFQFYFQDETSFSITCIMCTSIPSLQLKEKYFFFPMIHTEISKLLEAYYNNILYWCGRIRRIQCKTYIWRGFRLVALPWQ